MRFEALEYLSQNSKFFVEKIYGCDALGLNTDEEVGFRITMPNTFERDDDEVYAFVDTYANEIQFRVRGNSGTYEEFDAEIDVDALMALKNFCETITR